MKWLNKVLVAVWMCGCVDVWMWIGAGRCECVCVCLCERGMQGLVWRLLDIYIYILAIAKVIPVSITTCSNVHSW